MKNTRIIFTGEQIVDEFKIVDYPFNNFTVKIKIDSNNRFMGIKEIIESKSFVNYKTENLNSKQSEFESFYKIEA